MMKKAFSSSWSGMAADNHPWQLYKSFTDKEFEELLFTPSPGPIKQDKFGGKTLTYAPVFFSSTDYSEATDYLHHEVASIIGNGLMLKAGVPKIL
jgi:hypothetical protein